MAESINLTVDRREDLFLQVYWTNLDDVPFYVVAGLLDASSGGTVLLSSDAAYKGSTTKYAIHDITVSPPEKSDNVSIDSGSGLVTVSVPYSVVSTWTAGSYSYSLVVKYATSSETATDYHRKVLMTGTIEVV